ncbi:MAG: hypothetical protein WC055_01980 [Melioribacteraceae bacterium]
MKAKPIKEANHNALEELNCLCAELENKINQYSHVSMYLPANIKNNIRQFHENLINELEKLYK